VWSLIVIGEARSLLELVLGVAHRDAVDLVAVVGVLDVQGFERNGDVLFANAEKPADADHHGMNRAFAVDQHLVDVADFLVARAVHIGADELRAAHLLGALLVDEIAGLRERR